MSKLEKWLSNRNLLGRYLNNIQMGRYKSIEDVLYYISKSSYLSGVFIWKTSPEGYNFWRKVSEEWKECLLNNKL